MALQFKLHVRLFIVSEVSSRGDACFVWECVDPVGGIGSRWWGVDGMG